MRTPPYLDDSEVEELLGAAKRLGLAEHERLRLLRSTLLEGALGPELPTLNREGDQLRSDLLQLNKLDLTERGEPLLARWLHEATLLVQAGCRPHVATLKRLRNRILGKKEALRLGYLAPPDRQSWVAQLPEALGLHPDFVFETHPLGEREPDLVVLLLGTELSDVLFEQAMRFLDRFEATKAPPYLLMESRQPIPAHRRREAGRIGEIVDRAGLFARVEPVDPDDRFVEVLRERLPQLVAELGDPDRAGRFQRDRRRLLANVGLYRAYRDDAFKTVNDQVRALFEAGCYQEALDVIEQADKALEARREPTSEWRHQRARLGLNRVSCFLNLQQVEIAKRLVSEIDEAEVEELFDDEGRAMFARVLIWLERPGRAERLIPSTPAGNAARQLLAILRGEEVSVADDVEQLTLAGQYALHVGRYDEVARFALRLHQQAATSVLSQTQALQLMATALAFTVLEVDLVQPMAIEDRSAVVKLLEANFGGPVSEAPPHLREMISVARVNYRAVAFWIEVPREPEGTDSPTHLGSSAPWFPAVSEAEDLAQSGRFADALELIEARLVEWPEREPLEMLRAQFLLNLGRPEEAERPARTAFRLLPVPRNRVLLGRVLRALKRTEEAWGVVEPLRGHAHPEARRAYALAANHQPDSVLTTDQKISAWEAYLELERDDAIAQLQPALLLERDGRTEEARNRAWQAIQGVNAPLEILHHVAMMQMRAAETGRLRALLDRLKSDFPGDPMAERVRMEIWRHLGKPEDAAPDWTVLQQASGVRTMPLGEARQHLATSQWMTHAVAGVYGVGRLSIESLANAVEQPVALVVLTGLEGHTPFSPVHHLSFSGWEAQHPSELLVGADGLHLLADGAGLGHLERLLAQGHTLVLFRDVVERIEREALHLPRMTAPEELKSLLRSRALLFQVATFHPDTTDHDLAEQIDTVLLSGNPRFLGQVAATLEAQAWAESDDERRFLREFARGEALDVLPNPLVLGDGLLRLRLMAPLIALLQRAGVTLHYSAQVRAALDQEILQRETIQRAMERALQVHAFVGRMRAAGFLREEDRPTEAVERLLPVAQPGHEGARGLLVQDLTWREALVGHETRWFVAADFLPAALFGGGTPLEFFQALAWTPAHFQQVAAHFRALEGRMLSLGRWSSELPDAEALREHLFKRGLPDTLTTEALIRLARRSKGRMQTPELDRLERMARTPAHPGCDNARLVLSRTYAEGIAQLWQDETGNLLAPTVTHGLLERLEGPLSEAPGLRSIQSALVFLLSVVTRPGLEKLGQYLVEWVQARDHRMPWMTDALRNMWLGLDEKLAQPEPEPVTEHLFAALFNRVVRPLVEGIREPSRIVGLPPILQDLAVLSGRWRRVRPLELFGLQLTGSVGERAVSREELLQATAAPRTELVLASRIWLVQVFLDLPPFKGVEWFSPPEAILLRMAPAEASDFAAYLAHEAITFDARLSRALEAFSESPTEEERRRAVAQFAVCSPLRSFLMEPESFARWGWDGAEVYRFPQTLGELRELLGEEPLGEWDRLWRNRELRLTQVAQRAEVPGRSMWAGAWALVRDHSPEQAWLDAEAIFNDPQDQPAARVAVALFTLRLLTRRHRTLVIRGQEIDIRAWLRQRLPELLKSSAAPSEGLTRYEPDLLRLSFQIVHRFPDAGQSALAERLWLTWRLHAWLMAQCDALSDQRRQAALVALAQAAERLNQDGRLDDAFDPRRFGAHRLDHRLLLVLQALHTMELVTTDEEEQTADGYLPTSPELSEGLRSLVQRPMTNEEIEVARFEPATALDWSEAVTLPELALQVLLHLEPGAVLQLPEPERVKWLIYLGELGGPRRKVNGLLLARLATLHAAAMTPAERDIVRQWLEAEAEWTSLQGQAWLSLAMTNPMLATQRLHALLQADLSVQEAVTLAWRLLLLQVHRDPAGLAALLETLLAEAREAERDPVVIVLGLAGLLNVPDATVVEAAVALLRDLLSQPPFCDDERLRPYRPVVFEEA